MLRNVHSMLWNRNLALVLTVIIGVALPVGFQFSTPANAWQYLRGANYIVSPTVVDIGSGMPGTKEATKVRVRNLGFAPIRIVGAETTCNCLVAEGLPLTIQPRDTAEVGLSVFFTDSSEVRQMARLLFENGGKLHETTVVVVGKVKPTGPDREDQ